MHDTVHLMFQDHQTQVSCCRCFNISVCFAYTAARLEFGSGSGLEAFLAVADAKLLSCCLFVVGGPLGTFVLFSRASGSSEPSTWRAA